MASAVALLVQLVAALAITCIYVNLVARVLALPFMLIGFVLGAWSARRKRPVSPDGQMRLMTGELIYMTVAVPLLLAACYWYDLWSADWIRIWRSPTLLALLLWANLVGATHSRSLNPTTRNLATGSVYAGTLAVILVAVTAPGDSWLWPATFKWSLIAAGVAAVALNLVVARSSITRVGRFEVLNRRHDQIEERRSKLHRVADALNEPPASSLREALRTVSECYVSALQGLRSGEFDPVEAKILQAEAELTTSETLIEGRVRLSLKDELQASLAQAKESVVQLRGESGGISLEPAVFANVVSSIDDLAASLPTKTFTAEELPEQLEPFERVVRHVLDLRIALRFLRNVGSAIDHVRQELSEQQRFLNLARALNVQTTSADAAVEQTQKLLDGIVSIGVSSSDKIVTAYRNLLNELATLRQEAGLVSRAVDTRFTGSAIWNDEVRAYVPRVCSTSEAALGAVVLSAPAGDSISLGVKGVLIETELNGQDEERAVATPDALVVTPFRFVGKKAGKGILTLRLSRPDGRKTDLSVPVRIMSNASESATESFTYATPIGGVLGIGLFLLKIDAAIAFQVGAGVAGVVGLLLFGWKRYQATTGR